MNMRLSRDVPISAEDQAKFTALLDAVRYGDTSVLQSLIDEGADVADWRNLADQNLMHYAFIRGSAEMLLARVPELVDTPDDCGKTPLWTIMSMYMEGHIPGSFDLVTLLCEKASDSTVRDAMSRMIISTRQHIGGGCYSSNSTVAARRKQVVEYFLSKHGELVRNDEAGFGMLANAVTFNATDEAGMLIERGVDVNFASKNLPPLLHYVAAGMQQSYSGRLWEVTDYSSMVSLLIQNGINPDARDDKGRRAVDVLYKELHPMMEGWISKARESAGEAFGAVSAARSSVSEAVVAVSGVAEEYEAAKAAFDEAKKRLDAAREAYERLTGGGAN